MQLKSFLIKSSITPQSRQAVLPLSDTIGSMRSTVIFAWLSEFSFADYQQVSLQYYNIICTINSNIRRNKVKSILIASLPFNLQINQCKIVRQGANQIMLFRYHADPLSSYFLNRKSCLQIIASQGQGRIHSFSQIQKQLLLWLFSFVDCE